MAVIEFVRNYDDLSTDQGFQFKFYCNRCGNGYMSSFQSNPLGMAGGLFRAAGSIFGGMLGGVGDAAYNVQRAVGSPQHDAALQKAVQECKPLFTQCSRCGQWVCHQICWNESKGLCKECAPVLAEEIASAQAHAARDQVNEKARAVDQTQGADLSEQATARCPQCNAVVTGTGKFCGECGAPLQSKRFCRECGAKMEANAKFCPDCGTKG